MNPWLEQSALWHDVHEDLLVALRAELSAQLRPRYFVGIATHTYVSLAPTLPLRSRYPDVVIVNPLGVGGATTVVATPPVAEAYVPVNLPLGDPIEEAYLEVRAVPGGEVVTMIELLSHANKQPGSNRNQYEQKRHEILQTGVHFVEIDLLRAGPPMPYTEVVASQYRVFIRRSERYAQGRVYPFGVQQPIPVFALPLLPGDEEPPVDLNALLSGVYDRAGYELILRYDQPPEPPLSEAEAGWAQMVLNPKQP